MRLTAANLCGLALVASLGMQTSARAGIPIPSDENGDPLGGLQLAAKPKAKEKNGATKLPKEAFQQRGAEIDNFIYEIFDPNAPDPLADLGLVQFDSPSHAWRWWVAGGAAVLVGAGVAGYFLYFADPEKAYVDFSDSDPNGPLP